MYKAVSRKVTEKPFLLGENSVSWIPNEVHSTLHHVSLAVSTPFICLYLSSLRVLPLGENINRTHACSK